LGHDDRLSKEAFTMSTQEIIITDFTSDRLADVRGLFREYQASIGVDLCFQDFEREVEGLPGDCTPPWGRLRIVVAQDRVETGNLSESVEQTRLSLGKDNPPLRGNGTLPTPLPSAPLGKGGGTVERLAGCVALRRFEGNVCEMKRLYVRSAFRGTGLGRRLAGDVIEAARRIGYARMRLDTLPSMVEAIALYRSLGFVEIQPYRANPIRGAVHMELELLSG